MVARRRGDQHGPADCNGIGAGELPDHGAARDCGNPDPVAEDVFGADGYPQMLLRIGWAPVNADPLPATPRRPLSDVVTWLDGSRFD